MFKLILSQSKQHCFNGVFKAANLILAAVEAGLYKP